MTSSGSLQTLLKRCKYVLLIAGCVAIFLLLIFHRTHTHPNKLLGTIQHTTSQHVGSISISADINLPLNNCTLGSKVLILTKSRSNPALILLQALRIDYHTVSTASGLLLPNASDRYATHYYAIIITDATLYGVLTERETAHLNDYCLQIRCSIILFADTASAADSHTQHNYNITDLYLVLYPNSDWRVGEMSTAKSSNLFSFTKPGLTVKETNQIQNFTCIRSTHPNIKPLLYGLITHRSNAIDTACSFAVIQVSKSAVNTFFLGVDANFWLIKLIFLDIIQFLSPVSLLRRNLYPIRYIQVDIDDIFVAKPELKMRSDDVRNLVSSQSRIGNIIPGFKYNLGYCGAFFQKGPTEVMVADQLLMDNSHEFTWFGHLWTHSKPHLLSYEELLDTMKQDIHFSDQHQLSIQSMRYAVTPHHSGVYPIHTPLYDAWNTLHHVKVTSTQHYPSLHPSYLRRGFTYKGIEVLPRQHCGLFTTINRYSEYPGGIESLLQSVRGGKVFNSVLCNPVSIFMTHLSNYALDRLAPILLESLLLFITTYTNIKLMYTPPLQLSEVYFKTYPQDRQILWSKHSHLSEPLAASNSYPDFIIVGPQKTGSTALQFFLSHLPGFSTSIPDSTSFEETHFFSNSTRYDFGVNWYLRMFAPNYNNSSIIFEKSAGYFDNPVVPERIYSLLPTAKIVIILQDPIKRAYSWYQHLRSHSDVTAITHSFDEVLDDTYIQHISEHALLLKLRHKCLAPGRYLENIKNWLIYFKMHQIYFVDGMELIVNPISTVNKLQEYLAVSPTVDIQNLITYREEKGYYCLKSDFAKKCLGPSKGRNYPPISQKAHELLSDYYRAYNAQLAAVLTAYKRPLPEWLLHSDAV